MSFKSYCLRVRTEEDVLNVEKYVQSKEFPGYLVGIDQCEKNILAFKKGDYVILLTVDRGDLCGDMIELIGKHKKIYSKRLEQLPNVKFGDGYKVTCFKRVEFNQEVTIDNWAAALISLIKEHE